MLTQAQKDFIAASAEATAQAVVAKMSATPSTPTPAVAPAISSPVVARDSKDFGEAFGKFLQCFLCGGGKKSDVQDIYLRHYKGDGLVEKALNSTDFSAGGALVGVETAREIIELLRPATVVRQSGVMQAQMNTGTLEIPRQTAGSVGSYIGENQNSGQSQPTTGSLVLSRKKLQVLIPFSNDFVRFAVVNANEFIRQDAVRGLAVREDAAFIRDDGTQYTPRGLRFWVPSANVFNASGDSDTLPNIETRLRQAANALMAANVVVTNGVWLMNARSYQRLLTVRTGASADGEYAFRDELLAGRLWGARVFVSTQIPQDLGGGTESEVYYYNAPDMVIGEALSMNLDVFPGGAYWDGSAIQSGISRDQTVLRAIMEHDFGARHDESIAVISGVKWGV